VPNDWLPRVDAVVPMLVSPGVCGAGPKGCFVKALKVHSGLAGRGRSGTRFRTSSYSLPCQCLRLHWVLQALVACAVVSIIMQSACLLLVAWLPGPLSQ